MDCGPEDISLDDFKNAIPKQRIQVMQIISFGLVLGPSIFAVVAGAVNKESQTDDLAILQTVNFVIGSIMFVMSSIIPNVIMKGKSKASFEAQSAADLALNKIQSAQIVRLALVEGAALFGSVCVLIGVGYVNYITMIPLYFVFLTNLPTEKYICRQFILHVKKDPRLLVEIGEY